jgi:glycosyltransferase involved in cell wall biosynthesis
MKIRDSLGLADSFTIGIVGRLTRQKNQFFAVDVFNDLIRKNKNSKFIIVGEGEREEGLRNKVTQLGLERDVIFYGVTDDISSLYQAFDILLFPSNYEGLGLVAIEAQSAGLPVVASDAVPQEAKCTDIMKFLPLSAPLDEWSNAVLHFHDYVRMDTSADVKSAGWNINQLGELTFELYSLGRKI